MTKLYVYEVTKGQPISWSVFQQSIKKGAPLKEAVALALAGFRPTTTEEGKQRLQVLYDLWDMEKMAKAKASEIGKLQATNPIEAAKQKADFNKSQLEKLDKMFKDVGLTPTPQMRVGVQALKIYPYTPFQSVNP